MNPHERNAHKILSLARLPVPTLPHIFDFLSLVSRDFDIISNQTKYVNTYFYFSIFFYIFFIYYAFKLVQPRLFPPKNSHQSILISDNKQIKVFLIKNTCLLKKTVFDTQPDLFLHKPNLI